MLVWELQSFQRHCSFEGMDGATAFYGTEGTLIVDDEGWRCIARIGGEPSVRASEALTPRTSWTVSRVAR